MARWARRGRRSRRAVSRYWYLGNEAQPVIGPQRVDPFEYDDPYEIRQALAAVENDLSDLRQSLTALEQGITAVKEEMAEEKKK